MIRHGHGLSGGGVRIYRTRGDRARAVAVLAKRGFNYFVGFLDVQGQGLSFGKAEWVTGGYYRKYC